MSALDIPTFLLPAAPPPSSKRKLSRTDAAANAMASLPGEEWKPIPGMEGRYSVSNKGRVRRNRYSVERVVGAARVVAKINYNPRLLNPFKLDAGYGVGVYHVAVHVGGKSDTLSVGRLMLRAFVGEPPDKMARALPADNDPSNLSLSNWYWGTLATRNTLAAAGLLPPRKAKNQTRLTLPGGAAPSPNQMLALAKQAAEARKAERALQSATNKLDKLRRACKHPLLAVRVNGGGPTICAVCGKEVSEAPHA
jgi:hypothetical protein